MMKKFYPVYAIKHFGFRDGITRSIDHYKFTFTYKIPHTIKDFRERDRRKKASGITKYAINRDGDLFLVECPKCHSQNVCFVEGKKIFECYKCRIRFSVYMEDGVVRLIDCRKGNIKHFPRTAYHDIYPDHFYLLGIEGDAPWWWGKKAVNRDLHDGMDAHRHKPYEIIGHISEANESPQAETVQVGGTDA